MDPNATLKVTPERLAELASVDPDATPGPSAALRRLGSSRPPAVVPNTPRPPGASAQQSGPQSVRGSVPPSQSGAYVRASTRPSGFPKAPAKKGSTLGTVALYVFLAIVVSVAVIGLIALAGRLLQ